MLVKAFGGQVGANLVFACVLRCLETSIISAIVCPHRFRGTITINEPDFENTMCFQNRLFHMLCVKGEIGKRQKKNINNCV